MSLREGWFRPDKHYIEHNSHKARVTRASLSGSIRYQVFIKKVNGNWRMPFEKAFESLDDVMIVAESLLGLLPPEQQWVFDSSIQVPESGCWIWDGMVNHAGYGQIKQNGKSIGAHRHSYQVFRGEIPEGMFVCHHCDVPACVNPDHLFVGTCKDNMVDASRKGRLGKKSKPKLEKE